MSGTRIQRKFAWLSVTSHAHVAELVGQDGALAGDGLAPALDLRVAAPQGVLDGRLRERVDPEDRRHGGEQVRVRAHRVAARSPDRP
jgi:hypothetical protein